MLLAAYVIGTAAYMQVRTLDAEAVHAEMDKRATNFAARFELGLQRHLDALSSIHSFHHAVGSTLDVDSFSLFAQIEFTRHPGLHALSWNRHIGHEQRAAVEADLERRYGHGAGATERSADGQVIPTSPREEYVVVSMIAPSPRNASHLHAVRGARL